MQIYILLSKNNKTLLKFDKFLLKLTKRSRAKSPNLPPQSMFLRMNVTPKTLLSINQYSEIFLTVKRPNRQKTTTILKISPHFSLFYIYFFFLI